MGPCPHRGTKGLGGGNCMTNYGCNYYLDCGIMIPLVLPYSDIYGDPLMPQGLKGYFYWGAFCDWKGLTPRKVEVLLGTPPQAEWTAIVLPDIDLIQSLVTAIPTRRLIGEKYNPVFVQSLLGVGV